MPTEVQNVADFIYVNGKVYTVNPEQPWAEAVAVTGDKIVFVGDSFDAKAFEGPDTTVINLQGKVVLPGLISGHEHPIFVMGFSSGLQLEFTVDKEKMLASVREYVASHPDGPYFSLGGAFEGTVDITKDDIDAIISDKPFFMIAASVHGGWCNTKALEVANAEEADKSPHYLFGRDENGELNGYVASAKTVVYMLDQLKVIDETALLKTAPAVLGQMSQYGFTATYEAGCPPVEDAAFKVLEQLEKEGTLHVRLAASLMTQGSHMNDAAVEKAEKYIPMYQSDRFKVSTFKIHGDGSVDGWTAGLLEPHADKPGDFGMTSLTEENFHEMVMLAASKGWDIQIHTVGDRTCRYALDAFEEARKAGYTENRFSTGHTMLVHPDDVQRFVDLDVSANIFAVLMCVPSPVVLERLGEERYNRYQPNGSLDKAGVRVTMSADWPVATVDPWLQTAVCMERRNPGETEFLGREEDKMTAEEIVRAYTINPAYQIGWDDIIGSIEVGKKADIIVIDTDIFNSTAEEIAETKVITTMMDGKFVYSHLDGVMPKGYVDTTGLKPGYIFV